MVTCADDHHLVTGRFARGEDGFAKLVEIVEGFENQQIHAGFDQASACSRKMRAGFGERGRAQRFDVGAERPDGAGDISGIAAGFPRETHAGLVDRAQFLAPVQTRLAACDWRRTYWSPGSRRRL